MTSKEAIEILCDQIKGNKSEAMQMAIKALTQPEIIRCNECKHSEPWYRDKLRCFLWHEKGIDVFGDGFCNYAERIKKNNDSKE